MPLTENWRASLASTIMPAFVLGNAIAAILMRHTRSAMLQVLESDYVRTARAKGPVRALGDPQARDAQRADARSSRSARSNSARCCRARC